MRLPSPPKTQLIPLNEWMTALTAYVRSITPRESPAIWPEIHPNGTTFTLRRRGGLRPRPEQFPFQLYQTGAWNNVRVRGQGATINAAHCDNDDLSSNPLDAVVPPESSNYKFWIELGIETAEGGTQGNVTARTIKHGADPTAAGWDDYPDQPPGDSDTGAPPPKYFILIADGITTSNSTDQILTLPALQSTNSALTVSMYGWELFCESAGGFRLRKRLTHHPVAA